MKWYFGARVNALLKQLVLVALDIFKIVFKALHRFFCDYSYSDTHGRSIMTQVDEPPPQLAAPACDLTQTSSPPAGRLRRSNSGGKVFDDAKKMKIEAKLRSKGVCQVLLLDGQQQMRDRTNRGALSTLLWMVSPPPGLQVQLLTRADKQLSHCQPLPDSTQLACS